MNFREMRRKNQALSPQAVTEILQNETVGVLALAGDDDYPYTVPMNYVYDGEKLFFHSAKSGHKIDAIQRSAKASFCVIAKDQIVPEEYTTYFRSVIVFGQIRCLDEDVEKRTAIDLLARKYAPDDTTANREQAIARDWAPLCVLVMTIDHASGKEAIELVRTKEART